MSRQNKFQTVFCSRLICLEGLRPWLMFTCTESPSCIAISLINIGVTWTMQNNTMLQQRTLSLEPLAQRLFTYIKSFRYADDTKTAECVTVPAKCFSILAIFTEQERVEKPADAEHRLFRSPLVPMTQTPPAMRHFRARPIMYLLNKNQRKLFDSGAMPDVYMW